jgi:CRP-like cAMP-binding protein
MAMISVDRFRELYIDFPEYLKLLKKHLYKYKDPKLNFLKAMIMKIFYLAEMNKEEIHEILHNLKEENHPQGDYIMIDNNNDKADKLIFVESGCIEVFTYQEGNEFVIDYLE